MRLQNLCRAQLHTPSRVLHCLVADFKKLIGPNGFRGSRSMEYKCSGGSCFGLCWLSRPISICGAVSKHHLTHVQLCHFASMDRMPASTSTSRFSTMRPSKLKIQLSQEKESRVSPTTFNCGEPSAWIKDWPRDTT